MSALPALREDLQLMPAAAQRDGSPAWMIHDPAANRFYRIGWLEFELLSRWHLSDGERVLQDLNSRTPLRAKPAQLGELLSFLRAHQLLRASDAAAVADLARRARARQSTLGQWLLHHYLFFRVPLLRPQAMLARLAPRLGWLYTRGFALATLVAGLTGLYLVARQWDAFVHTFTDQFDPTGLLCFALALLLAKTIHELAHAVTATRHGVRVAQMGVAFLVLWPMLYTDTSESWKLRNPRSRLAIAAAGLLAELCLAAWATLAWALVDDGPVRSALFFLATTSWVLTLGINASPFMRFDGYFLLSDALDMPNLHERSGELARRRIRRWLLGWHDPDPEPLPTRLRRLLVAFALATWLYRLTVFLGIAVAVYLFFFKLAGIVLFAVEIVWFILRPVSLELREWWVHRRRIRSSRALMSLLGLALLLGVLAWPWPREVSGEGWLHAERQQPIFSPFAARIVALNPAGRVKAGEVLAELESPDQKAGSALARAAVDALDTQLTQSAAFAAGREQRASLASQLARERAAWQAHEREQQRLSLRAPFDGTVVDVDPQLRRGVWVSARQPIAWLVDPQAWVVDAFVSQRDAERVRPGAAARLLLRAQPELELAGEVLAIDDSRTAVLPHPMLASERGGRIAAQVQADGSLVPRESIYRVRVRLDRAPPMARMQLGTVRIEAQRRSLLGEWLTLAAAVWVRESGF